MNVSGITRLTNKNFLLYCSQVCQDSECLDISGLQDTLKYIGYIKRLFTEYEDIGELKYRLALNHIITLYNVFGAEHAVRILFFKIHKRHYSTLKSFLTFMNLMPDVVDGLSGDIRNDTIDVDDNILVNLEVL